MNRNSAQFRRGTKSYQRIPRREYLIRAIEFASRGEQIAKKLTDSDIREIRKNKHGLTDKEQSIKFNVSKNYIYKIRHYHAWGHVI